MKELLYIPSGRFVRFFNFVDGSYSSIPTVSFEQFTKSIEGKHPTNGFGDETYILDKLINRYYIDTIYTHAEIPEIGKLTIDEFELVEMDDAGYNVS